MGKGRRGVWDLQLVSSGLGAQSWCHSRRWGEESITTLQRYHGAGGGGKERIAGVGLTTGVVAKGGGGFIVIVIAKRMGDLQQVSGWGAFTTLEGCCQGRVLLSKVAIEGATSDQWQLHADDNGRLHRGCLGRGRVG